MRLDPVRGGGEPRIVDQIVSRDHLTEFTPELFVANCDDEITIGRFQRFVRHDGRVSVAHPARCLVGGEVDPGLIGEQCGYRVEHPAVDELTATGAVARQQRDGYSVRRKHPRDDIGDRDTEPIGWSIV